ncbi:NUDIX hydrolase [Catellatospora chokoriensis]|uniref:NUDIX hydrolase n=1 Tax=Catellatospora chokoriensis TaxID=310353 RepID=A0A8J3K7I4_9ACTN|nr:NUDIX domain-containing protein [Catellatospora chokoriensis]GIF89904.1 NUDIX hydrolase [Catellatospora chokoriensis]
MRVPGTSIGRVTQTLHADAVRLLTDWRPPTDAEADWTQTIALLAQGPQVMGKPHLDGHVTASAIIVSHDRSRILLCLHGRHDIWCQLGGHLEPEDGDLAAAALREATEESGIAGLVVDPVPVDVDVHHVNCAGRPNRHYDVIFLVHAPADAVAQVSEESHELGWFAPDALPSPLGTDTARVVRNAMARLG